MGACVLIVYLTLIYGIYVPDWHFTVDNIDSADYGKILTVCLCLLIRHIFTTNKMNSFPHGCVSAKYSEDLVDVIYDYRVDMMLLHIEFQLTAESKGT